MQPNNTYSAISFLRTRTAKLVLTVVGLICLGFAALSIMQALQFHIVRTSPSLSSVASVSTFITVDFNRSLSMQGLKVTSSPAFVTSYTVQGKVLTVRFKQTLVGGKKYTVIINTISDNGGKQLLNKQLTFTPKNIAFKDLPPTQAKALVNQQADQPYDKDAINYGGFDGLINQGTSSAQIDSLEQAFYNYSVSLKQHFKQISIDTSTIQYKPIDRNNPSPITTIYFSVAIDGATYQATLNESGLSTVDLTLFTPSTTTLVYDSGSIDTSGLDSTHE